MGGAGQNEASGARAIEATTLHPLEPPEPRTDHPPLLTLSAVFNFRAMVRKGSALKDIVKPGFKWLSAKVAKKCPVNRTLFGSCCSRADVNDPVPEGVAEGDCTWYRGGLVFEAHRLVYHSA